MRNTRFSRVSTSLAAAGGAAALMLVGLGSASAHVTGDPTTTSAGSYTLVSFSVGHGCEGSSTTSVKISLPEELNAATPTVNSNWTISTETQKFNEPKTLADGSKISQRTAAITYTAKTPLIDHQRDVFVLSFKVPDATGKTLYFPTLQTCEKGSTNWADIPKDGQDPESLKAPAPSFTVTAASAEDGHGGHGANASGAATASSSANASDASSHMDNANHSSGSDSADNTPLWPAWLGLGAGLAGLVMGAFALMRSRKTTP